MGLTFEESKTISKLFDLMGEVASIKKENEMLKEQLEHEKAEKQKIFDMVNKRQEQPHD